METKLIKKNLGIIFGLDGKIFFLKLFHFLHSTNLSIFTLSPADYLTLRPDFQTLRQNKIEKK
ncbi:hypothetical protein BpHYR1_036412 [Brachionus plicatilis]|uniref:Uncharacterized protein n=1 Tax=Brachionus plicatilis TaxID=10195 RepID=A0A3M7SJ76_BRAPC|nr:hypothetical protein BpHYR1_036412 [Brachionus plicatilis]